VNDSAKVNLFSFFIFIYQRPKDVLSTDNTWIIFWFLVYEATYLFIQFSRSIVFSFFVCSSFVIKFMYQRAKNVLCIHYTGVSFLFFVQLTTYLLSLLFMFVVVFFLLLSDHKCIFLRFFSSMIVLQSSNNFIGSL
jgi:hypothetical protein